MTTPTSTPPRILLGHLFSNGDCLYATVIARQIKEDFPRCHLTWAISKACRSIVRGNPHVDAVWEVPLPEQQTGDVPGAWEAHVEMWRRFKREALARKARGEFDEVFLTHIGARTFHHYDGTIRSIVYGAYPRPITVSMTPVLRLESDEVENVRRFVAAHPALGQRTHCILFECSPKSGQAAVNPDFAVEVARKFLALEPDACFVLSSNIAIQSVDGRIIDGSALTLRENAELTKHCTLLIGCSSGITWLCTSDWAKPLPMIQLYGASAGFPNSVVRDHQRWNLPTDGLLELVDCSADRLCECLLSVFQRGFASTKARFHQPVSVAASYGHVQGQLLRKGLYRRTFSFLYNNLRREGIRPSLLYIPARTFLRHFRASVHNWIKRLVRQSDAPLAHDGSAS